LKNSRKNKYAISKRYRRLIFCGILLLAGGLVALDRFMSETAVDYDTSTAVSEQRDFEKYHGKTFLVTNVVDGDTIDINIPDGDENYTRIRLWGVDTPEVYGQNAPMYYGEQASDFVENILKDEKVTVYLDKDNNTRGYYGRLLAYVQLEDGRFLNEILLKEGYAYADPRFQHSYSRKYQQLESAAKSLEKGLWKNVQPEDMPEWKREKVLSD
jgi:micrococcal nuclease